MKKLIIPFLSILALTACEKENTDNIVDVGGTQIETLNISLIQSVDNNYQFNVTNADHELFAQVQIPCVASNALSEYTWPSVNYLSDPNYNDGVSWFCRSLYQSDGVPLCKVSSTSSHYYSFVDDDCQRSPCFQYYCDYNQSGLFRSRDLNSGKGDWLYMWFGTSKRYAAQYWPEPVYERGNAEGVLYYDFNYKSQASTDAPLTGVILVVNDSDNYPPFVTDRSGITYYPVQGASGSVDDFNNNSGAEEYLHLYATTDVNTGRKLMFTHPDMLDYSQCANWDDEHGGDSMIDAMIFSFPMSWTEGKTYKQRSECYTVDQIKSYLKERTSNTAVQNLIDTRLDFIRTYNLDSDGLLAPWNEGRPGNFQEGKNNSAVFISYSYITPDDPSWNNF